jgi:hypothetical protein
MKKYTQAVLKFLKLNTQTQQREAIVHGRNLMPVPALIYFFFSKVGVISVVVLFVFCVLTSGTVLAQHQFRRPSKSDIDWLLGNNEKSKLPNRNSIDRDNEFLEDDNMISHAAFQSRGNLPEPCQSIRCSKNGSKLRSPNCRCEYCAVNDSCYVEPCGKVNPKPNTQKIKQINFQIDQQSPDIDNTEADEIDYDDEKTTQPIIAVESGFPAKSTTTKTVKKPASNSKNQNTVVEFAEQKPTPIETDSTKNTTLNAVKIAYPDSIETEPVQLTAPQTNVVTKSKTNAIALSARPENQHKIAAAPQTAKKQKKYANEINDDIDCDCAAAHNGSHDPFCQQYDNYNIKCTKNTYDKNCSCEHCNQSVGCGAGEIVADTCVGFLFHQIARLRHARLRHNTKHGGQCNCWLCANLDNPDMTGNGLWNLQRVAGFGNGNFNVGSLQISPNMFLSRSNVSTHFNAEARNRVWFDYRQFNNAATTALLLPNGNVIAQDRSINQFIFGLEKHIGTQSSLEVRIPLLYQFSSEADSLIGNGFNLRAGNTELGNITLSTKYVFARTKKVTLATGLGVLLPTAEDWDVKNFDASISNRAYNIITYVAAQWHPNDSTFGHLLVQADIPVSKNELRFNGQRNKIEESQIIQAGIQLGRWFYRNECGMYSCRIGGFVEVNYAVAVNSADKIMVVDNVNRSIWIDSTSDKPDYLTLAAGLPLSFGQLSVNNAVIMPLSNDHQFSVAYNFSLCRRF